MSRWDVPGKSPPCGAVVAYRLRAPKLRGDCKPALPVPSFTAKPPRSLPAGARLRDGDGGRLPQLDYRPLRLGYAIEVEDRIVDGGFGPAYLGEER